MNFIWTPTKATLLLEIPEPTIPDTVLSYANTNGLMKKQEFHITLLSFQNGKKLLQQNNIPLEPVFEFAQTLDWSYELLNEYAVLERRIPEFVLQGKVQTPAHTRVSIIQKIKLASFQVFFDYLASHAGIMLELPFPHVTLFTWSDYEREARNGIAINSQADFEKYFKQSIVL